MPQCVAGTKIHTHHPLEVLKYMDGWKMKGECVEPKKNGMIVVAHLSLTSLQCHVGRNEAR
jgi:hypothetical protein